MSPWRKRISLRKEPDLTFSQVRVRLAVSVKHDDNIRKARAERCMLKKLQSYQTTIKIQSLERNSIEYKLRTVLEALQLVSGECTPTTMLDCDSDTLFKYTYNTINAYADRRTPCGRLRTHDDYRRREDSTPVDINYTTLLLEESKQSLDKVGALLSSTFEITRNDVSKVAKLWENLQQRTQASSK